MLEGLRRLIGGHPLVSPDLLRIYFVGFGTTSLDVEISAYVRTTDIDEFSAVREDLFLRMIDTIAQCGTALARPINLPTVGTPPASAGAGRHQSIRGRASARSSWLRARSSGARRRASRSRRAACSVSVGEARLKVAHRR